MKYIFLLIYIWISVCQGEGHILEGYIVLSDDVKSSTDGLEVSSIDYYTLPQNDVGFAVGQINRLFLEFGFIDFFTLKGAIGLNFSSLHGDTLYFGRAVGRLNDIDGDWIDDLLISNLNSLYYYSFQLDGFTEVRKAPETSLNDIRSIELNSNGGRTKLTCVYWISQ